MEMGFVLMMILAIFMLCRSAFAQSSSCATTLLTLSPCLNYVTGNTTTPSSSCCSSLTNVVATKPQCLCLLVNGGGSSFGYSINQTLAMELPQVCNVRTPPRSRCNGAGNGTGSAPSPSPLSSPADGSTQPTDAPPSPLSSPTDGSTQPTDPPSSDPSSIPSGSRSTTFPTTNGSSSSRSYMASFIQLTALALFIHNCLDS